MALAAGARLGPYEIQGPLGAGGMGEVYRARDARLGRNVAIKVLPSAYSADPERLRRFEQEARAAAALNDPRILAVYDVGTHEGSPYLVTELLEGATLRERLAEGPIPQRRAVEFAADIARGLAAAHANGIAHRDLKHENLFITRDGRVKILDFGLAKLTRPDAADAGRSKAATIGIDTDPGMILGTVGYMAPEQVRGEPADHRVDIFALGAILHEMLSGQRPFRRDTAVETMNAILKEDPPDLSSAPRPVSPALERIVLHCLEKDPAARFQSAQDVAFNLETLSGLTEPGGALAPTAKRRRALRPLVAALALASILALAFLLARAIRGGTPEPPSYQQITFRKGVVFSARFAPDGQTILYSAAWQGSPLQIYMGRIGSPESRPLGLAGTNLLSVSSAGEMALSLGAQRPTHLLTRGTLARAPLAGGAPREVLGDVLGADWSPDGSSLAVIHKVGGHFRLEFPVGKVLYETGGWLNDIRVSPKGDMVAFLDHPVVQDDRGSVKVVDLKGKTRTLSSGWSTEEGLAWAPSGREVWFTAGAGINFRSLHAATLSGAVRLVSRVPGGITLLDVSRDGRVLLMSDDERSDMCAILPGEPVEKDLTWLDFSVPADLSSDGKTVVFTEQGAAAGDLYSVYVREVDGAPATRLGEGNALAFSPDTQSILAILYTSPPQLEVLPKGPGETRRLPNPGFERFADRGAGWTQDGKNVLFAAEMPGRGLRGYVQSIETGKTRPITPEGIGGLLVSARGDSVYAADGTGRAFAYPTDGGTPRPVSIKGIEPGDKFIRFSGDGRLLYVTQDAMQSAKLYRVDVVTRGRSLLRELKPIENAGLLGVPSVVVSADGRTVVFMARRYLSRLYLAKGLR